MTDEQPKPKYGWCDGCGKDRPTYRRGDGGLGFCFLCVKEGERENERLRRQEDEER